MISTSDALCPFRSARWVSLSTATTELRLPISGTNCRIPPPPRGFLPGRPQCQSSTHYAAPQEEGSHDDLNEDDEDEGLNPRGLAPLSAGGGAECYQCGKVGDGALSRLGGVEEEGEEAYTKVEAIMERLVVVHRRLGYACGGVGHCSRDCFQGFKCYNCSGVVSSSVF